MLLLLALLVGIGALPVQGQTDQQVSFRLSRLETEIRTLRSQVDQLDGQIERLQRRDGLAVEERAPAPVSEPEADLNYDQLATLVIETRQDVFALQERLAQLEARLAAVAESVAEPAEDAL